MEIRPPVTDQAVVERRQIAPRWVCGGGALLPARALSRRWNEPADDSCRSSGTASAHYSAGTIPSRDIHSSRKLRLRLSSVLWQNCLGVDSFPQQPRHQRCRDEFRLVVAAEDELRVVRRRVGYLRPQWDLDRLAAMLRLISDRLSR